MGNSKRFKRLVRARMKETGQTYMQAMYEVKAELERPEPPPPEYPKPVTTRMESPVIIIARESRLTIDEIEIDMCEVHRLIGCVECEPLRPKYVPRSEE